MLLHIHTHRHRPFRWRATTDHRQRNPFVVDMQTDDRRSTRAAAAATAAAARHGVGMRLHWRMTD